MASDAQLEHWRRRRAGAQWSVAVGMAMLMGGATAGALAGLQVPLLVGAVLSTSYGLAAWSFWGYRIHRATDPWKYDPELDGPDAPDLGKADDPAGVGPGGRA